MSYKEALKRYNKATMVALQDPLDPATMSRSQIKRRKKKNKQLRHFAEQLDREEKGNQTQSRKRKLNRRDESSSGQSKKSSHGDQISKKQKIDNKKGQKVKNQEESNQEQTVTSTVEDVRVHEHTT